MNWFTKKKVLIISLFGSVVFTFAAFTDIQWSVEACYGGDFCGDVSEFLRFYSLVFIFTLLFSLITLKLKDSTFSVWRSYSVVAVSLVLIVIFLLPIRSNGFDMFPIVKGNSAFVLSVVYSVISLIIIIYNSFKKDRI